MHKSEEVYLDVFDVQARTYKFVLENNNRKIFNNTQAAYQYLVTNNLLDNAWRMLHVYNHDEH